MQKLKRSVQKNSFRRHIANEENTAALGIREVRDEQELFFDNTVLFMYEMEEQRRAQQKSGIKLGIRLRVADSCIREPAIRKYSRNRTKQTSWSWMVRKMVSRMVNEEYEAFVLRDK